MVGNKPRNILVITYWSWSDALVQAFTLPYLRIMQKVLPPGSTIHLVTLEKSSTRMDDEQVELGIVRHVFQYRPFGIRGVGMLFRLVWELVNLVRRKDLDTVHVWCMPAGMVGYVVSKITGRPLIIDSYEPHAEAMVENGTWRRNGLAYRILFMFERLQTRHAKVVIAAVSSMREYALRTYGYVPHNFYVKPACVDLERFGWQNVKRHELLERYGLQGKLVAVYAGKFGGIYLDQEVFDLLRAALDHWGARFHILLLTSHSMEELEPFMRRAGVEPDRLTRIFVPHADMPDHLGMADFAITPVKPVATKRYCTPIKDGEYWAMGLPVIITQNISDDSGIVQEHGIGSVLEGLAEDAYRRSIREMDALLRQHTREELYRMIRKVAEEYRGYDRAEEIYSKIYGVM
jgi:glycosyltransferase involved in cell wall biosynthesis